MEICPVLLLNCLRVTFSHSKCVPSSYSRICKHFNVPKRALWIFYLLSLSMFENHTTLMSGSKTIFGVHVKGMLSGISLRLGFQDKTIKFYFKVKKYGKIPEQVLLMFPFFSPRILSVYLSMLILRIFYLYVSLYYNLGKFCNILSGS